MRKKLNDYSAMLRYMLTMILMLMVSGNAMAQVEQEAEQAEMNSPELMNEDEDPAEKELRDLLERAGNGDG